MPETLRLEDAVELGESRAAARASCSQTLWVMHGERTMVLNEGLHFEELN